MKSNTRDVVIIFDDITEFHAIRGAIDAMTKQGISVDIIVPYDSSYGDLPQKTLKLIQDFGYKAMEDAPKNASYKIVMTPYPCFGVLSRMKYRYHIKYNYGPCAATKPDPVLHPNQKIQYDASIHYATIDSQIFSAYGVDCYVTNYHRFIDSPKKDASKKQKELVILPTFGEISCIDLLTEEVITKLKKDYKITIKAHHAIDFREDEKAHLEKIKSLADEYCDSSVDVAELIKRADIVLSDNSGAIFDAIRAGTPVALLNNNLEARTLGRLHSAQCHYAKNGTIPYAETADELPQALKKALSSDIREKQNAARKELFNEDCDDYSDFVSIIKDYLGRDYENDLHKAARDLLIKDYEEKCKQIHELSGLLADARFKEGELRKELNGIYNSASWKLTKPLRAANAIRHKK